MKLSHPLSSGMTLVADVYDDDAAIGHQLLARLAPAAEKLKQGEHTMAELDWATVRLHAELPTVVVEEPDYGRLADQFLPSFERTARVASLQHQLLQKLEVNGQPIGVHQYLGATEDALRATSVVGRRNPESDPIFTGWKLVSPDDQRAAPSGLYRVRELTAIRLAWCVALILPVNWAFRFVGNTLLDCVSADGQTHSVLMSVDL